MYKCLTLTYHHPSTQYWVTDPPISHHLQIPPINLLMYMGAWGIQMCGGIQTYRGHQNIWGHINVRACTDIP